ncbi:MAG: hypothetical protein SO146_05340, partial [Eubacteriales bacterium]|nr:hypothetical protein [Eubacteriales bacterium]
AAGLIPAAMPIISKTSSPKYTACKNRITKAPRFSRTGIRKTIRYRSQEHRHLNTERNARKIIKIIGRFFLHMVEYVAFF